MNSHYICDLINIHGGRTGINSGRIVGLQCLGKTMSLESSSERLVY